jgi:hypothetical protein
MATDRVPVAGPEKAGFSPSNPRDLRAGEPWKLVAPVDFYGSLTLGIGAPKARKVVFVWSLWPPVILVSVV